jgi:hypothetical protein
LKEWLEEKMSKGFIPQSLSPFAAPVRFAKKPGGGLRCYIDYWDINSKTIRNRYPVTWIYATLKLFGDARIYTKLDVRGAYNFLQVKEADEHKLAFRTRYGLYEPTVMQFGTTNAPADVQGYKLNAIRESLDDFASAYLDGILIYINSEGDHVGHVKSIMQQLLVAGLYVEPKQCEFH